MRLPLVILAAIVLSCVSCQAYTVYEAWDFDANSFREGWEVPETLGGSVSGGSMWLTIRTGVQGYNPSGIASQMFTQDNPEVLSPAGLAIDAAKTSKVRMRLLNMSPETDGLLFWSSKDSPDKFPGVLRFTMKPYCREWQDVVVEVDERWGCATVDRLKIRPGTLFRCGDIWIDRIEITDGPPRARTVRPDIVSKNVVPQVVLPGVTQADFEDAFKVLDECMITNVPVHGFPYPVLAPGGAYGENWWVLDSSLNLAGAKWANQDFAEDCIRGFWTVQKMNPDGRIDLWGGSPARGAPADLSGLPRYFEVAYDIARRSNDVAFRRGVCKSMSAYLDWWMSAVKRDETTGLITAVSEECPSDQAPSAKSLVGIETNVAIALGLWQTADLAGSLGDRTKAALYRSRFGTLASAIDRYLWNEADGRYYNYDCKKRQQIPRITCTMFDAMRLGIASTGQTDRLIAQLTDPKLFNWGKVPVTSVAMIDPSYVEAIGPYDGRAWNGDIWTMRNLPIIDGLEDAGQHDLAAELAWATVKIFNRNWREYLKPSDGSGHGVDRYGWSASQWIQTVIEHVFGVDYDARYQRIRVFPHIASEIRGKRIELRHLVIPGRTQSRLDLALESDSSGVTLVDAKLHNASPSATVEIFVPKEGAGIRFIDAMTGRAVQHMATPRDMRGAVGIRIAAAKPLKVKVVRE